MTHPKPEEWIELLYGETENHALLAQLQEHLTSCPDCRERFAALQQTRAQLQTWKVASPPFAKVNAAFARFGLCPADFLKAAAVVVVLLGFGFGLGRLAAPAPADPARLRAELRDELTRQIQSELNDFAAAEALQRQEYQAAIIKAIGRLEAQRKLELASLRQDVETVAVNTQDELENTQEGLYQLAAAESPPPKP
jgi:hypothetical protein